MRRDRRTSRPSRQGTFEEAPEEEVLRLLRVHREDPNALGDLLDRYRDRLRNVVRFRLDNRLRARVDPSDIVQETFVEALQRVEGYLARPRVPFYLWLRFIALQKTLQFHRRHRTKKRDVRVEVAAGVGRRLAGTTSEVFADHLLASDTSPSEAAARAELRVELLSALDGLEPLDREILALRHFECLSNEEASHVLGIKASAASTRYARALKRLGTRLTVP